MRSVVGSRRKFLSIRAILQQSLTINLIYQRILKDISFDNYKTSNGQFIYLCNFFGSFWGVLRGFIFMLTIHSPDAAVMQLASKQLARSSYRVTYTYTYSQSPASAAYLCQNICDDDIIDSKSIFEPGECESRAFISLDV